MSDTQFYTAKSAANLRKALRWIFSARIFQYVLRKFHYVPSIFHYVPSIFRYVPRKFIPNLSLEKSRHEISTQFIGLRKIYIATR